MENPTMEIKAKMQDGKRAIEVVVRNGIRISEELDALGFVHDCTIANRQSLVCATAEELDATRDGLKKFFGEKGQFIG